MPRMQINQESSVPPVPTMPCQGLGSKGLMIHNNHSDFNLYLKGKGRGPLRASGHIFILIVHAHPLLLLLLLLLRTWRRHEQVLIILFHVALT